MTVTANDAAAAGLLPPEQAEAMSQKGVAPTQRQLELLALAKPGKRTCRAVVVGLDGAGKTSILVALRTGRAAESVAPTQGCNKSALYRDDVSGQWTPESGDHASFGLELLDLGGGAAQRVYWPQLAAGSTAILAVVDGREADEARWAALAKALEELRVSTPLSAAPLALLVNRRGAAEDSCASPSEALPRLRLGGLTDAAAAARLRLGGGGVGGRVLGLSIASSGDAARATAALEWTWSQLAPEQVGIVEWSWVGRYSRVGRWSGVGR